MNITGIEWTDFSVNPLKYKDANGNVVWACIHASPGCMRCYSEQIAQRYGRGGPFNVATMEGLKPFMDKKELHHMQTAKTIKGKPVSGGKCFVGDMTDLFGEWVPCDLLDKLFAVFAIREDIIWQVLTKRADRLKEYCNDPFLYQRIHERIKDRMGYSNPKRRAFNSFDWPPPNVWFGVSAENQQYANERIPHLLDAKAAVRFVSYEPALGSVKFRSIGVPQAAPVGASPLSDYPRVLYWDALTGFRATSMYSGSEHNAKLDWVIVGGESGGDARPFDIRWALDVVQQCKNAGVPVFVKQLGRRPIDSNYQFGVHAPEDKRSLKAQADLKMKHAGFNLIMLKSGKGNDPSEWPEELRVREFPKTAP